MLDENTQKNEMEISDETCIFSGRMMGMKAAGWNPELSTKYKTYRDVGRPKKRWEGEVDDFLRPERAEVGRTWKASSQSRQQHLLAQGT